MPREAWRQLPRESCSHSRVGSSWGMPGLVCQVLMKCKEEPVRSSTEGWEMSFPRGRGFSTACQSRECQLCTWPLPGKCRHSPGATGETSQNFWKRIKPNPEAELAGVYGVCKVPHGFCTTPLASQAPPGLSAPAPHPLCGSGGLKG